MTAESDKQPPSDINKEQALKRLEDYQVNYDPRSAQAASYVGAATLRVVKEEEAIARLAEERRQSLILVNLFDQYCAAHQAELTMPSQSDLLRQSERITINPESAEASSEPSLAGLIHNFVNEMAGRIISTKGETNFSLIERGQVSRQLRHYYDEVIPELQERFQDPDELAEAQTDYLASGINRAKQVASAFPEISIVKHLQSGFDSQDYHIANKAAQAVHAAYGWRFQHVTTENYNVAPDGAVTQPIDPAALRRIG